MEFEFPAVTICSLIKLKVTRVRSYIRRTLGRNFSTEESESYVSTLLAISLLQFPHYNYASEYIAILNSSSLKPIQNEDIPKIMIEVGHQIDDLFEICTWKGKPLNCKDIFHLQKTEEGFCYSFNSRTAELENRTNFTPLKNYLSGRHTGLGVTLKDPSDGNGFRKFARRYDGYNVIIHNPNEIPDVTNAYQIKRSSDKINTIIVSPQKFLADETIKNLPAKVRDCYWLEPTEEEEASHIFLRNGFCQASCRRDAIRSNCGCVPYFFEPVPGVKFCSIEHAKCLANMNVKLRNFDMYDLEDMKECNQTIDTWSCRCIKFCSHVNYQTQFSTAPYHLLFSTNEYAHLDVTYFRRWGQTYRKEVKFTFGDLSAAVGGYASLLLGSSLISFLEIFYYFLRCLYLFITARFTNKKVVMDTRTQSTKTIINYVEYPFLP
ncbi:unnamed protein product [Nezara viridula]|uniref:Sodium channel protein Nach n=1 Tax=Nezara viridula TaxID=85310 RepID=A0A9P0HT66_NEZVI|nr:unnamed protein product [Nezara viridula]